MVSYCVAWTGVLSLIFHPQSCMRQSYLDLLGLIYLTYLSWQCNCKQEIFLLRQQQKLCHRDKYFTVFRCDNYGHSATALPDRWMRQKEDRLVIDIEIPCITLQYGDPEAQGG